MGPTIAHRKRRRRERRPAAIGAAASRVLASLLGGLALVVFALRDLDLRLELRRRPTRDGESR